MSHPELDARMWESVACAVMVACGGRSELSGMHRRVSVDTSPWVSQRANGVMAATLVADDAGSPFVAWQDDVPSAKGDIYCCRMVAGDASSGCDAQNLSDSLERSSAPAAAAVGRQVLVAWVEGDGDQAGVLLRASPDGGQTFAPAVLVSDRADGDTVPALAAFAGGLLVAWNAPRLGADQPATRELLVARSFDGGSSFSEPVAVALTAPSGAPALAVDRAGRFFLASSDQPSSAEGHTIGLFRSLDGGTSFVNMNFAGGETRDGPKLGADLAGNLWLLWASGFTAPDGWNPGGLVLSRSTDGGANFADRMLVRGAIERPLLALDRNGGVVAGWNSPSGDGSSGRDLRDYSAYVIRSSAGGEVFGEPVRVEPPAKPLALGADASTAWLGVSERIGFFGDLRVHTLAADGVPAGVRAITTHQTIGPAQIGADAGGPAVATLADGTLLVAWVAREYRLPSDHGGVFVIRSQDGGATFSEPVKIARFGPPVDGENCPIPEQLDWSYDTVYGYRSWAALSPGTDRDVLVAWPDPTLDPADGCHRAEARILVSRSRDGGGSFSAPVNLSRTAADPGGSIPSYGPNIVRIGSNLVWVVWHGYGAVTAPCPMYRAAHVFGAVSRDGGDAFSPATGLSDATDPDFCGSADLARAAAGAGTDLYLAWVATSAEPPGNQRLVLAHSTDGGQSFFEQAGVDLGWERGADEVTMATDSSGEPALAYRLDRDGLFVAPLDRPGGTALVPLAVSQGWHLASGLDLQPLGGADFVLLYGERPGAGAPADILGVRWSASSGSLSSSHDLSANAGDSDRPRGFTDRNGSLYVVWQDDTDSPGTPAIRVARLGKTGASW